MWFHYRRAHLERLAVPGTELAAYGRVQRSVRGLEIAHPDLCPSTPGSKLKPPGIHPVYTLVAGVPDKVVRSTIRVALDRFSDRFVDPVPESILSRLNFPGMAEALHKVHLPPDEASLDELNSFKTPAQRRILFDRFLGVMLSLAVVAPCGSKYVSPPLASFEGVLEDLEARFPFRFTPDQAAVIQDVIRDLAGDRPMQRLVMGDVGCGKTAVAAAAVHLCVRSGAQAALMAPTRLLAEQHAETFASLSASLGLRTGLLTGGMKGQERALLLERIGRGEINLVIGTHALVQEELVFSRLGLAVIDEQQRFGVRARARLLEKGGGPHLLVLTATPIPRTLAMTAYGDLNISLIRERPAGRLPVITRLVEENEKHELAGFLAERMSAGQQVIVICPAVEASAERDLKDVETMTGGLKRFYSNRFRVGMVHGRLSEEERQSVIDRFRRGRLHILVATTVIEVGMHLPNATVMVVEHPERFGLSQLHQLRGRVGRGSVQGTCCLILSRDLSEGGLARLRTLAAIDDGFRIAEQDRLMRGHGELTGLRQSGPGELDLEDVLAHPDLIEEAKRAVEEILRSDPALEQPQNASLLRMVNEILGRPSA